MITDVPPVVATPVTVVVDDGPVVTVATRVVPLLQVPPAVELLKVIVVPGHMVAGPPVIGRRAHGLYSSAPISGVVTLRV